MKNINKVALVVAGVAASSSAFAGVSETIATMQTQMTSDVTTVGTALIAVAAVVVGFKWLKAMLFGG